jgi:phosphoribosylamine--glycine ligase
MRVLGITETCDLGSLYMRLLAEGHDVKVTVSDALAQGTMAGLVPRAPNWREELDWIREDGGIIIFEAIGFGALQDDLRTQGFSVIGGSAFGDRLENDRSFALEMLGSRGLNIAHRQGDVIYPFQVEHLTFAGCYSKRSAFTGSSRAAK